MVDEPKFQFSPIDEEELSSVRFHKKMTKRYNQALAILAQFDCPNCNSPTFFPYGAEKEDLRQVRRWLCKQCGLYYGPEGQHWALYDPVTDLMDTPLKVRGCWQLERDASRWSFLPQDLVRSAKDDAIKEHDAE